MHRPPAPSGGSSQPGAGGAPVALVHDYLTQRGGAERVVVAMARAFPDAAVHTALYEPDSTWPEFAGIDVRPSPLNRIALLRRRHRLALPLLARTFSTMRVDADVALCSSSGWAHAAAVSGRKVVYCHAPARWLYQTDRYLAGAGRLTTAATRAMLPALRRWDQRAAATADRYLVNSRAVQDLVFQVYGIRAEVVHPPVLVLDGPARPADGTEPGFFLTVGRLMVYKNVASIVAAFANLPGQRLVVVGDGPQMDVLRAAAGPNVTLVGAVDDDALRWYYQNAFALVAASHEDFGLTPIEAAAWGCPTVALRAGGYLDTVVEGETGVFFDEPQPLAIARAVTGAAGADWSTAQLRDHAGRFSQEHFMQTLRDVVS